MLQPGFSENVRYTISPETARNAESKNGLRMYEMCRLGAFMKVNSSKSILSQRWLTLLRVGHLMAPGHCLMTLHSCGTCTWLPITPRCSWCDSEKGWHPEAAGQWHRWLLRFPECFQIVHPRLLLSTHFSLLPEWPVISQTLQVVILEEPSTWIWNLKTVVFFMLSLSLYVDGW